MVQVALSELPAAQFTVGLVAKMKGCTLGEAREALDKLVDAKKLSRKVATSGARNYKVIASKKSTKSTPKKRTAPKKSAPAKTSASTRDLAKKEHAALKEWEQNGGKGTRPDTSNYDAIAATSSQSFGGRARKPRKASGESTPRGTTVRFLIDGKPMPDSQNKLSSVAWYHTAGVLKDRHDEDRKRITVEELREILAGVGVKDPSNEVGWVVELANGKTISTAAL